MKFYLYSNPTNTKEYTLRMIRYLFNKHGLAMVDDPQDSDCVMVSICDSDEITDIEKAKKHGKPVLAGGMVSEIPILNELSDYVYHGEIYGLIDHLKAGGGLDDCKHITTKQSKRLNICQEIKWEENPIIKVGRRAAYYYCGKGCPVKCKYCLIGNGRKYQAVPEKIYRGAERTIVKSKGRMMPIAAYNPHAAKTERGITEVLLKKYIKGNGLGLKNSLIRSGVEFVTEEYSRGFAKAVNVDDVNHAIEISKRNNSRMILYFIAGLETQEQVADYFNQIDMDYETKPVITVVFTYLAPQPLTPIFDMDIRQRVKIDAKKIYHIANNRNKRLRFMPLAGIKKSTMRALSERALNIDQWEFVKSLKKKSVDYGMIIKAAEEKYPHLLGSASIKDCLSRKRGLQGVIGDYWDL